jgi:two-component system, OmpR family, sensor histidine kinase BaeS
VRNRQIFGIGQLGRRLVLAFVAVALAAIAVNATISSATLDSDINRLAIQQEGSLTQAIALTARAAYEGHGWARMDLDPVRHMARRGEASVEVYDMSGKPVGGSAHFSTFPKVNELVRPVVVRGRQVGQVTVRFSSQSPGVVLRNFQATRWRARLMAAGIASLLAFIVSLIVARAISAPLEKLLAAVRARGAGARSVLVKPVRGTGVIRELLDAFNATSSALDRQDRLRRNLVADVAHELRTPTAVLQASIEAMIDGVARMTPGNICSLRDEVLRLARMVDDLQRLAAAESASLQLRLARHDLAAIADEAALSLADSFSAANVGLNRLLTEVYVMGDRARMREVILNLLTNALKFTQPGGSVTLKVGPGGSRMTSVEVSDTGVGIAPDDLPHVTERFFRGAHSAEMATGSGIGLTIVAELVEAHHGHLEIRSSVGEGTEVTVTLPVAAEARRRALQRSAGQE